MEQQEAFGVYNVHGGQVYYIYFCELCMYSEMSITNMLVVQFFSLFFPWVIYLILLLLYRQIRDNC